MEYTEDNYLMISGIQHFKFCRRQWALIHIEQQWAENVHTAIGEIMHQRVHDPVSSREMGVSGECDVVEFRLSEDGIRLHGHRGLYSIYPVEYKKGKPKLTEEDRLQLAAQAMCLEEMLMTQIEEGAVYYGETRRRTRAVFTEELRSRVRICFEEMHQLYKRRYTPKVKWSKSCNACSLRDICLPKLGKTSTVEHYIEKIIGEDTE